MDKKERAAPLIIGMLQREVFVKQLEAGLPIHFDQVGIKGRAPAEQAVKRLVPEADDGVVLDGAAIVDALDVGPQAGGQTHRAWLAGGVQLAAGKVEGFQLFSASRMAVISPCAVESVLCTTMLWPVPTT